MLLDYKLCTRVVVIVAVISSGVIMMGCSQDRAALEQEIRNVVLDLQPELKGEVGKQGEAGQQGLPGQPGATGLKGPKGDTGDRGVKGEKGDIGEKGDPGVRGLPGQDGKDTPNLSLIHI